MRMPPVRSRLVLLTLLLAHPLAAQTTDAAIAGTVRDSAGAPLADVTLELRNRSTGFRTVVTTNGAGRFALLQLPLGGPYDLQARRVGFRPASRRGVQLGLGDRVAVELVLAPAVVQLDEVTVAGAPAGAREARIGGSTHIDADALQAIPAVGRNFTDLAALSPFSGSQQSLGGQRYTATDIRLDGLQAKNLLRGGEYGGGPYTVSLEAVREFEVNTNVYDVSQGRQGGGVISAVTKAGTNRWSGSAFGYRRSSGWSAATDYLGRGRDVRDFTNAQFGGTVSGPIVRDRLQFFASFDRQQGDQPLFTGYLQTPQDQITAGVAADSLTRMISILQAKYGLSTTTPQLGRLARSPVANTFLGRLDWTLSPKHLLTLRHNYSDWSNPLGGGVDQAITLAEARSDFRSYEHQALASLRSVLGATSQNELTVGFSASTRRLTPESTIPRGFVRIQSILPDGSRGDIRVQFGGNRLAPDQSLEHQVQLVDRFFLQRGTVLFTAGTDNSLAHLSTYIAESQSGLFEFNSLTDLDALRPNRYSRSVPLVDRPTSRQQVLDLGAYLQGEWRPDERLTVTGGLRYDATGFLTAPAYNPLVEQLLGLRTDRRPQDWLALQPRAQVVWNPHRDGRDVVRLGGGRFTAQAPYYAQNNSILYTGLQVADIDLRTNIPVPDYPLYRQDPSQIPGIPAGAATPPALVNLVGDSFRLPSTWKANLTYQRRVTSWFTVTGSLFAAKTTGNYYYVDRNLVDVPAFTLANEANRPVFVPASTIDALGRTDVRNALKTTQLGRVIELQSIGEGNQRAATVEGELRLPKGGSLHASYTWNRSRDNSTYGCCLARTATTWTAVPGDPRNLAGSWGPSDLDFRHKLVIVGSTPTVRGVRLSGRYVGSTGRPFSLVTNGDINGDEANGNDLAFLFDPNNPSTPPAVAAAMARILANPNNYAADYIRAHLGQIAGRNGAYAPWNGRVDLRLSTRLEFGHGQSAELTVDCVNFLNLLDRSWGGQYLLPAGISDQNPVLQRLPLLNVTGFDQATQTYTYTVNENAGVLQKQGDPYTIQLGLRYGF